MNTSSNKKIWFITGISRGLGQALAEAALSRGDTVIGTSRDGQADIQPDKSKLHVYPLDVTDRKQVEDVVKKAYLLSWRLDIVVNNAGYGLLGAIETTEPKESDQVMDVNFRGTVNVIQAALPYLRDQSKGHIINVSSIAGIAPFGGYAFYAAAKFAVEGLSISLAHEVQPLGIKVTVVEPGAFRTDFLADTSLRIAGNHIADYKDSVGTVIEKLEKMNGKQPGDPVKGAKAILDIVDSKDPPLHFLLGSDAYSRASAHMEALTQEMQKWKSLSLSTDFAELAYLPSAAKSAATVRSRNQTP